MSEAMYILIFMVVFFSSMAIWAFYFAERKDNRKWRAEQRKEKEKEIRFQKLKADAKVRRAEIDEKYRMANERSDDIKNELMELEQWNARNLKHVEHAHTE